MAVSEYGLAKTAAERIPLTETTFALLQEKENGAAVKCGSTFVNIQSLPKCVPLLKSSPSKKERNGL